MEKAKFLYCYYPLIIMSSYIPEGQSQQKKGLCKKSGVEYKEEEE